MNISLRRKMPTAQALKDMYPLSEEAANIKADRDAEIESILKGETRKLILIIGPCSADREDAVLEYLSRLKELQKQVYDKLFFIPRIYTNKPRTTGEGYKGMMHQPDPNSRPDMLKGLISIRHLHIRALEEMGFSCADEMLYPENHTYLSDVLSYVAVGARSVEDQYHRLVASGIKIPVGMKNPTSGDLTVMMNSIFAAQHGHSFVYSGWEVQSEGNPLAHAILRGSVNKYGRSLPNYHYEDLISLCRLYDDIGLQNPGVIVDVNHSNSNKIWQECPRIAKEVVRSAKNSEAIGGILKGLMIESYLEDGCQKPGGDIFGKSITDPCLGWEKTEQLVLRLADIY